MIKRINIIKPENLREYKKFLFYIVACFTIGIISSINYQCESDRVRDYGVEWKTKTDVECTVLNKSENIDKDRIATRLISVKYDNRIIKDIPTDLATFEKATIGKTISIKLSKSDIYGEDKSDMKESVVSGLITTITAPLLFIGLVLLIRKSKNIVYKKEEEYLIRISEKYKISISDFPNDEVNEILADYNWKHWLKVQLPITLAITSNIYYIIVCIIYWSVAFKYYFV